MQKCSNVKKLRTAEPQPMFTGSYKRKKSVQHNKTQQQNTTTTTTPKRLECDLSVISLVYITFLFGLDSTQLVYITW